MKPVQKIALVVPNNRRLRCWSHYLQNFEKFNHRLDNIKLFVVDDYSPFIKDNLELQKKSESSFEYWTIEKQQHFFKNHFGENWKKFWQVIPHRTDACRSFGYLVAVLWGADQIITFDDDNYPINNNTSKEHDYIGAHSIVNNRFNGIEVSSDKRWFNTISMLVTEPPKRIYARGYPYDKRDEFYSFSKSDGIVVMNVGLWTGNPDVDAITVLNEGSMNGLPQTKTTGLRSHTRVMLAKNIFAPLNTANTAYSTKLLPCIYDTFQGAPVGELKLDRFGDIWCHLFVKKIVDAVGETITVGVPLVEHRREPRDTFIDFTKEFWGIIISQRLFKIIEDIHIESKTYFEAYDELIYNLKKVKLCPESSFITKYFNKLLKNMSRWLHIIEKLRIN